MSRLLYFLFIRIYPFFIRIASVFNQKAKHWINGRKQTAILLRSFRHELKKSVWFHCASLGEFEQARPVIEAIKKQYPHQKIILTFFSPSGYEVQKNYALADKVMYLPMDSKRNAQQFIAATEPAIAIFVKYEYWYYYLKTLHQQQIPLFLISGIFRDDQPFFKWYGSFHRNMLQYFTWFFVQHKNAADLLNSIHIKNYSVAGDNRFDRVMSIAENFTPIAAIEDFSSNRKTVVAGSTWLEDDKVLSHFANAHPEIQFIIAPHDISDVRIKECLSLYKNAVLYSHCKQQPELLSASHILIIDNIGMLSRLYRYATVAMIGGGFGGDGVHNVLEAAVYGKPLVYGPVYEKYKEAIDLVELQAAFVTLNALELEETLILLLNNQEIYANASAAASNYTIQQAGATKKIMDYFQEKRLLTR